MKKLSILFFVIALVLSHVMCAVIAYEYCNMVWGQTQGWSAPPESALVLAIPYLIGIGLCLILARHFKK